MDGEHRTVCPRCDGTFDGAEAYAVHRRDVHGLVDDEGLGEGDADDGFALGALDLGVLAAAAVSLARSDEPDDEREDVAVGASSPRRRTGALAAAGVVLLAVATARWALDAGDDPTVAGRRPADAPVVEVEGASEEPATTVPATTTVAADPSPATAAPAAPPTSGPPGPTSSRTTLATSSPPATSPPATSPPTTSPPTTSPPTTTTTGVPPTSVTATEATVVSCTDDAVDRTLVFTYVLTGSADDGLHEAAVTAPVSQGPITVATVPAIEPDGDPVTVRLQPGPVTCV